LPRNDPKKRDLQAGAIVFMDIQIERFLGNVSAINHKEGFLKFITDRGNATRAEIETFYRNGIRALISEIVDDVFKENTSDTSFENSTQRADTLVAINLIVKNSILSFYLSPNQTVFNTLKTICENHYTLVRGGNADASAVAMDAAGYRNSARDLREQAKQYRETVSRYCNALNIKVSDISINNIHWIIIRDVIMGTFYELDHNLVNNWK
jgi:hypothetical protein